MPQRDEPHRRQQLERQALYHEQAFKVPGYRLARGLRAAAHRYRSLSMLNQA